MNFKIVSDSSSNIFHVEGANYVTVPMKVIADKEYVDTPDLDLAAVVEGMKNHKGKSGSSCPNVQEWLDAFGDDADGIFGVTISRNLSGSYNAAREAAQEYAEEHPDKKIYIFDTLSAGPEQAMVIEKIQECISAGHDFDTIIQKVKEYQDHTFILFRLESLMNLARNGRVNPAVAKIAGVLGIRVIGDAQNGQIIPAHKPRGDKKAMPMLLEMMEERGLYDGALIRIAHCFGQEPALLLKQTVLAKYPNCRFIIEPTTALCSFYAEAGGLMIGMEGGYNETNNTTMM